MNAPFRRPTRLSRELRRSQLAVYLAPTAAPFLERGPCICGHEQRTHDHDEEAACNRCECSGYIEDA